MSSRVEFVVVGGGLAGITAALDLADAGARVRLLERRARLGGATFSFTRHDRLTDNGQHVLLRCYTSYLGLLDRLGTRAAAGLQDRLSLPVLEPATGRSAVLRRTGLPAPAHLLGPLLRYRMLTPADRARVLRAAAALRRLDPQDPDLDRRTLAGWLAEQGQGPRARAALWDLIAVPALNCDPEQASLALAARVFRTGLLEAASNGDIGVPQVALSRLHGGPALRALASAGVDVRLSEAVRSVRPAEAGRLSVATSRSELNAEGVVMATPHEPAGRLLPPGVSPTQARWAELGHTPILDVHVLFDRSVASFGPMLALLGTPTPWVFDRSAALGLEPGRYLTMPVSAASDLIDTPTAAIREQVMPALATAFPAVNGALVEDFFVTRNREATFHQRAGTAALRPRASTSLPGLTLAGAWTATGWPDTLEGAVRSGHTAASTLLERLGRVGAPPVPATSPDRPRTHPRRTEVAHP